MEEHENIVGDITHGAWSNPLLKRVLKEFGKRAFARSSACMEFEPFLKRIGAGGKACVEIGTYNGITALVLSQYFDEVFCVSIDDDPHMIRDEVLAFAGAKNVICLDVKSNVEKAEAIGKLEFDFCYMDGDHAHDTESDFLLVERCGRVLFHEYWPIQAPVWNLVNALPQHEVVRASHDCFAYWERGRRG